MVTFYLSYFNGNSVGGAFLIFISVVFYDVGVLAVEPENAQKEEWKKLYPKLNSKMARMEELLNRIDRFHGDVDFTDTSLAYAEEFSYLAKQAIHNIPGYLHEDQREPYIEQLLEIHKLGKALCRALQEKDDDKVRMIFSELDKVRQKSHAKWAE